VIHRHIRLAAVAAGLLFWLQNDAHLCRPAPDKIEGNLKKSDTKDLRVSRVSIDGWQRIPSTSGAFS
jgi:hypothetical protein